MTTWLSWIFQVDLPPCLNIWVTNHVVQSSYRSRTSSTGLVTFSTQEYWNWETPMETFVPTTAHNRRSGFFNAVRRVKLSKISSKLQLCWCWLLPSHFLVCPFRYSLDLKFKCRISGISNVIENSLLFFFAAFHLGKVCFFLFLSSFHLFDIAMGTDPPLLLHSNWLPGSHHCHFLITHNPLWASPLQGLLDHQI